MAHKKGVGSSRNGRDSNPKMLGVKRYDGQYVTAGSIIVRQRGTKINAGNHVGLGRDHTLFALIEGYVKFEHDSRKKRRVSIFSTSGTAHALQMVGIQVEPVTALTKFPEILDGRVKTLHPAIFGGILARRDVPAHMDELQEHEIAPIDIVAVNLYPFAETIARPGVTITEALEQIDIGGAALIRAAAKNFQDVIVLVRPQDYAPVMQELQEKGRVSFDTRRRLAAIAFQHTASYDSLIAEYLRAQTAEPEYFP